MGNLDITYGCIDSNAKLSEPLKSDIKGLMTLFNKYYPEVDLTTFNERVKNLEVKKGNKYVVGEPVKYLARDNVICINEKKLMQDEVSGIHSMMYSLVNMASAKDYYYGFDNNGDLGSLNVGTTLLIVNALIGSPEMLDKLGTSSNEQSLKVINGQEYYTKDEYIKMYVDTVFRDVMHLKADELLDAYFNNKPEMILNRINELNNSQVLLNSIKEMSYAIEADNYDVMVDCFENLNEKKSSITRQQNIETLEEEKKVRTI